MKRKPIIFQPSPLKIAFGGILVLIALWLSRLVTAADNETVLPLSVLQQLIDNNHNSLPNCHLEWEIREKGHLPLEGVSEESIVNSNPGTTSSYASDRYGSRYAITAIEQKITTNGEIDEANSRSVFNGTEFRSLSSNGRRKLGIALEPKFRRDQSWLEVIGWTDSSLLEDLAGGKIPQVHVSQSILVDNGNGNAGRLQELVCTNNQDGSKLIVVYNIDQGGCKQSERWINAKGQVYYRWESEASEVMEGVWLPAAISSWSLESQSGKVAFERKAKLNLPACKFGDAYQPNETVFELPIEYDMEVVDLRAGTRVTYNGSDAPTSLAELKKRIERGDATISENVPIERVNIQRHSGPMKWLLIVNGICLIAIAIIIAFVWWRRGH